MRKKILIIIVSIVALFVYLFRFIMVNRGFNTLYDEAHFLLALREAKMGQISGGTQWNLLAVKLFPFVDLSYKINAYIINLCISLVMATLVSIVSAYIHVKKYGVQNRFKTWFVYFVVCLLVYMLFLHANQEFTYVSLQVLLFTIEVSLFALGLYCDKLWKRRLCSMALGGVSALSVFVILPSGICVLFSWVLLTIVMEWKNVKEIVLQLLCFVVGIFIGLALFHLCVVNLTLVFEKMQETAKNITSLQRGYDLNSFVKNIIRFIRDIVMCFVMVVGAWFISYKVKNNGRFWKLIGDGMFLLFVLYMYRYQKSLTVTSSMLCMTIAAVPVLLNCLNGPIKDYKRTIYAFFLFVFPLIATLGTNIYVGSRIGCFVFSWVLLYVEMYDELRKNLGQNTILFVSISVVIIMAQLLLLKKWEADENAFQLKHKNTPMDGLYLRSTQVEFFDKFFDIVETYNFSQDSSIVMGFNEEMAAIYVMDPKKWIAPYGLYDFLYDDKYSHIEQPDFMLWPERWDAELTGSERCYWDWDDYDVYHIGTPDPVSYINTNNMLYCRKCLK